MIMSLVVIQFTLSGSAQKITRDDEPLNLGCAFINLQIKIIG